MAKHLKNVFFCRCAVAESPFAYSVGGKPQHQHLHLVDESQVAARSLPGVSGQKGWANTTQPYVIMLTPLLSILTNLRMSHASKLSKFHTLLTFD